MTFSSDCVVGFGSVEPVDAYAVARLIRRGSLRISGGLIYLNFGILQVRRVIAELLTGFSVLLSNNFTVSGIVFDPLYPFDWGVFNSLGKRVTEFRCDTCETESWVVFKSLLGRGVVPPIYRHTKVIERGRRYLTTCGIIVFWWDSPEECVVGHE